MLDIRLIRKNRSAVETKLKSKDPQIDLSNICELDYQIREGKTKVEHLKARRNEYSQKIGELKRVGQGVNDLMDQVAQFADEIQHTDQQIKQLEAEFQSEFSRLPNLPMDDIKISQNPSDNVIIKEVGQKPSFSFSFKNHVELNEKLQLFDFKREQKLQVLVGPSIEKWEHVSNGLFSNTCLKFILRMDSLN